MHGALTRRARRAGGSPTPPGRPSITACWSISRWWRRQPVPPDPIPPDPARLRRPPPPRAPRKVTGRARTSLRSAARTSGVAAAGPAMRKSARASSAVSPLRSVRAPPISSHPPPRPGWEYTGTPAMAQAFEVPAGRAFAHLELMGQLGRGDATPRLQDQQGGDEPVGTHMSSLVEKWPEDGQFQGACMTSSTERAPARARQNGDDTMPGLVPPVADERAGPSGLPLAAARCPALRRPRPERRAGVGPADSVSELCLAGLIKHAGLVERAWTTFLVSGDTGVFVPGDDWADGFRLVGTETLDDVIALADGQARDTEKVVRGPSPTSARRSRRPRTSCRGSPAASVWTPRWVLFHLIEETARHAGHADIIRESIDGAGCWTLMAAAEGWPEQDWGVGPRRHWAGRSLAGACRLRSGRTSHARGARSGSPVWTPRSRPSSTRTRSRSPTAPSSWTPARPPAASGRWRRRWPPSTG